MQTKPMLSARDFTAAARNVSLPKPARNSALSDLKGWDDFKVTHRYPRGSVLFVEGQKPRGVYGLCKGRAKVSITSADGKTMVLRIARPGDLLGMNATLVNRPYGATVQTLESCVVEFIKRDDLMKLLELDKRFYVDLAQLLCRKLTSAVEHTRLLFLSQSAAEKLARLLVKWCDEQGESTEQGTRIDNGLTHEEMGQMICVSRETVTRVLSELKRKHIISLAGDGIFVHNQEALEAVARY